MAAADMRRGVGALASESVSWLHKGALLQECWDFVRHRRGLNGWYKATALNAHDESIKTDENEHDMKEETAKFASASIIKR